MDSYRLPIKKPLVGAHRGASSLAPENTLAAFQLALDLGAPALELDVQLSSDGEIVVIHDQILDRTTNGTGLVHEHTIKELRTLDAGEWFAGQFHGERIPLLDEVLTLAKGRTLLNIELKHGPIFYENLEARVASVVRSHGMENDALLMSFDHIAVQRAKSVASDIRTCIVYAARLLNPVIYAKEIGADGINQPWYWLTRDVVESCHDNGLIVHASLIDDVQEWELAQTLGVDMVDTNNLQEILKMTKHKP